MKSWNTCDIEKLRLLYLDQKPIKLIARELNRSATSINKALTRFNIRPLKSIKHTNPLETIKIKIDEEQPITKFQLVHYARQNINWNITMDTKDIIRLNGGIVTVKQLLYKVNKYRQDHLLSFFKIEEDEIFQGNKKTSA